MLLVGVGHERNTYIHSVEEVLNVPNRLLDMPMELVIELLKEDEDNKNKKLPYYNMADGWKNVLIVMGDTIIITSYAGRYM